MYYLSRFLRLTTEYKHAVTVRSTQMIYKCIQKYKRDYKILVFTSWGELVYSYN